MDESSSQERINVACRRLLKENEDLRTEVRRMKVVRELILHMKN